MRSRSDIAQEIQASRSHRATLLAEVSALHHGGMSIKEAEAVIGIDLDGEPLPDPARCPFIPSPAEIDAQCAEFRATWSQGETERRWQIPAETWETPTVSTAGLWL